ncbi:PHP domain-containing protein [bacterium]|nr:PHP domain-containing protein [bacterium]
MKIDLHIHTTYSDGMFSPEKVVDAAIDAGLDAIALTDHDNILSHEPAIAYANSLAEKTGKKPLEIIRGVEINTLYKGFEIHILGYFMDENNSDFQAMLKTQQKARVEQTKAIVSLLNKKAGIAIKFEDIKKLVASGGSIGRPHIAKAITVKGGTDNVIEAYSKYINDDSPVYVKRNSVSPHEAVEVIYEAGGIPVFAHPFDVDIAEEITKELMHHGLRGLEAYHRKHSPAMVEYFSTLAEKLGLIVTGGSDFHAPNPNNGQIIMGKNFIPDWIYDKLYAEKHRLDLARN